MYRALPDEVRSQARKAFLLFREDPSHPSLRFKPLRGYPDFWTLSYRALCRRDGETVHWFWIGSHADFDRDFG
jgi:hypothetical protein